MPTLNMAVDLASFGRWTLRDKTVQRWSRLRFAGGRLTTTQLFE